MKPLPEIHLDATQRFYITPEQAAQMRESHVIVNGPASISLFLYLRKFARQLTITTPKPTLH